MEQQRRLGFKRGVGLLMLGLAVSSCGETAPPDPPKVDGGGGGGAGGASTSASSGGDAGDGDAGDGGVVLCLTPGPLTGDIPCNVFEVMHRTCHACHADPLMEGAPFPLLSYENTQAPYFMTTRVFQRMNEVIRPGGAPRMPPGNNLNDQDLKVLGDWLNQCAPPTADGKGCECPAPGMGCN
jgi:hypothetical protein